MTQFKNSTVMLFNVYLFFFVSLITAIPAPQAAAPDAVSSNYWVSQIKRQGTVAYGADPGYKVFRNVKDYGAIGDGNADDTDAINKAILDGNRCGKGCDSSTTTPAIIYFPTGTYKVSSPIVMYYYSQLIGDALTPPTILGAPNFEGLAILDANPYIPGGYGANWYTNQNNFYRQVRNFVVDMRQMSEGQNGAEQNGIHWQVAQATSLQNIRFEMRVGGDNNRQRGIFIENGSGGVMSDLTFNGGQFGMNIGSQQFTTRNLTFNNCGTAIMLIWDWLWTFKSVNINNCQVGLNMSALNDGNQTVGSAVLMDSTFVGTDIGVVTAHSAQSQPKTGGTLVVHNVDFTGAQIAIAAADGSALVQGGSKVASWVQGDAYLPASGTERIKRAPQADNEEQCEIEVVTSTSTVTASQTTATKLPPFVANNGTSNATSTATPMTTLLPTGNSTAGALGPNAKCTSSAIPATSTRVQQPLTPPTLPANLLDSTGGVFQRSRPQYEDVPASSFVSVKDAGAKGDGLSDDSDVLQRVFDSATNDQVIYFDHGAYVITKTIQVPKNIRITGEIWPLIMIQGAFFGDANNPKPAFRIGTPGDTGAVEISDLIFETAGPAPGAVMMEWNVAETSQGSCAMWDTHFRVGGTAGTQLQQDTCLANITEHKVFRPECAGSFLMMHITQQATAYFENTWFWLADHELDMSGHNQTTIFNGRGILVESQGPTWLWGTASEHNVFYNYQFNNAQNVFMGAIQTETAYFQAAPNALEGGFTPNPSYNDPDFADCTGQACKKTWGLRALESNDIYMFGGGLYSFFEDYKQTCLLTEDCQDSMIDLQCSNNIFLYGLVTKASTNMVNVNGQPVAFQKDHPNLFGATVALFQQA